LSLDGTTIVRSGIAVVAGSSVLGGSKGFVAAGMGVAMPTVAVGAIVAGTTINVSLGENAPVARNRLVGETSEESFIGIDGCKSFESVTSLLSDKSLVYEKPWLFSKTGVGDKCSVIV
jgi:hypothetical protein